MKKTISLVMAAALVLAMAGMASARHMTPQGGANLQTYGYFRTFAGGIDNSNFADEGDTDSFAAGQRVRQFFDYIANENLKATVGYEIDSTWGGSSAPAGADQTGQLEIKRANVAFTLPNTETQMKAGIQFVALPGGATSNPVLTGDMGGVTVSSPISDVANLTFGWARPVDNGGDNAAPGLDTFFAAIPIEQDGVNVSPFAAYSAIGQDVRNGISVDNVFDYSLNGGNPGNDFSYALTGYNGLYGKGLSTIGSFVQNENDFGLQDDANAYWLGTSFNVNRFDPIGVRGSIIYGALNTDKDYNERKGYFFDLAANYEMEMMTPEIFTIYGSGEDDDVTDGSEAFPMIYNDGLMNMAPNMAVGDLTSSGGDIGGVSLLQTNPAGIWMTGLSLKNIQLAEKLSSTLNFTYYMGTNDEETGIYLDGASNIQDGMEVSLIDQRLTDKDSAYEIALRSDYQVYENLTAIMEAHYVKLDMEKELSTADGGTYDRGSDYKDEPAYRLAVGLKYSF